jgi:hypothetical protein
MANNNLDTLISQIISGGLIALVIGIIVFLICREIVCWYFKINKNIALLYEIKNLLAAINNSLIKTSTISVNSSTDTIAGFDRAQWNALIQYDKDIAIVAEKLAPFGDKWMDEFASSYMALNDKAYLPQIEQKLIAAARAEAEENERQRIKAAEEQSAAAEEQSEFNQWKSSRWARPK